MAKHTVKKGSQQPTRVGLRSQDRRRPVAASAPGQISRTFHHFPYLPVEIQLQIWNEAYRGLVPSVLCFKMEVVVTSEGRIASFTPEEDVTPSTLEQRALMRTCYQVRQEILKTTGHLTVLRFDKATGTSTELTIPFNFHQTCFCIDNWKGHGMDAGRRRRFDGMAFAKEVRRLAFVVDDRHISPSMERVGEELRRLIIPFHNVTHLAGISKGAAEVRGLLGPEVFLSLFSFQPFDQKNMVQQDFLISKEWHMRHRIFYQAIRSAFSGWNARLRAAVRGGDPRLDDILRAFGSPARTHVPAPMLILEALF